MFFSYWTITANIVAHVRKMINGIVQDNWSHLRLSIYDWFFMILHIYYTRSYCSTQWSICYPTGKRVERRRRIEQKSLELEFWWRDAARTHSELSKSMMEYQKQEVVQRFWRQDQVDWPDWLQVMSYNREWDGSTTKRCRNDLSSYPCSSIDMQNWKDDSPWGGYVHTTAILIPTKQNIWSSGLGAVQS